MDSQYGIAHVIPFFYIYYIYWIYCDCGTSATPSTEPDLILIYLLVEKVLLNQI